MRQTVINIRYGIMPVNGLAAYYVLSLFILLIPSGGGAAESEGRDEGEYSDPTEMLLFCIGITFDTENGGIKNDRNIYHNGNGDICHACP